MQQPAALNLLEHGPSGASVLAQRLGLIRPTTDLTDQISTVTL